VESKILTGSIEVSEENFGVLCGTVSEESGLTGTVNSKWNVSGTVTIDGGREKYTGSYEVTPRADEQILDTANKIMSDDVTIKEIPYAEVTNPAGGITVIIG
jgi:hypothetical protein